MLFLFVDCKILKIVESEAQAFYWADLLAPKSDYYVNEVSVAGLQGFTDVELRKIHDNHSDGIKASSSWSREALIGSVLKVMNNIEADQTAEYLLNGKLGGKYSDPKIEPVSATQQLKNCGDVTQAGKGVVSTTTRTASTTAKRPKPGTASARIWDKCDEIREVKGFEFVKTGVAEWGDTQGINPSTERTQFGHWRRFNGL